MIYSLMISIDQGEACILNALELRIDTFRRVYAWQSICSVSRKKAKRILV